MSEDTHARPVIRIQTILEVVIAALLAWTTSSLVDLQKQMASVLVKVDRNATDIHDMRDDFRRAIENQPQHGVSP